MRRREDWEERWTCLARDHTEILADEFRKSQPCFKTLERIIQGVYFYASSTKLLYSWVILTILTSCHVTHQVLNCPKDRMLGEYIVSDSETGVITEYCEVQIELPPTRNHGYCLQYVTISLISWAPIFLKVARYYQMGFWPCKVPKDERARRPSTGSILYTHNHQFPTERLHWGRRSIYWHRPISSLLNALLLYQERELAADQKAGCMGRDCRATCSKCTDIMKT